MSRTATPSRGRRGSAALPRQSPSTSFERTRYDATTSRGGLTVVLNPLTVHPRGKRNESPVELSEKPRAFSPPHAVRLRAAVAAQRTAQRDISLYYSVRGHASP